MIENTEDVAKIFMNATTYLPLRHFVLPFLPTIKQLLHCRASILEGITGAAPPPLQYLREQFPPSI
jgi:hypothetical protein